jgi:hypothetical protein
LCNKEEYLRRQPQKPKKPTLQELPDSQLSITDLLRKYEIAYKSGKYHWQDREYQSYKEPLAAAQAQAKENTDSLVQHRG